MTWNYRVIEFVDPTTDEPWQAIHEVYYDEHGKPISYTEEPACVVSTDAAGHPASLMWVLDRMREALMKQVLRETDFRSSVEQQESKP